jgi:uncharacterized protein (DUF2252 family)
VPELVAIRYGRMLVSPFAFFRGAAAVMAHDLAVLPRTGLSTQICGDAHLLNFGWFASPERDLVFDLNDFDETLPGPFEWDLKRLVASFEIAGRDRNLSDSQRERAVLGAAGAYRKAMGQYAAMGDLKVWYAKLDAGSLAAGVRAAHDRKLEKALRQTEAKALRNDDIRALVKLTHEVDGEPRFVSEPPLLVPLAELADGAAADELASRIDGIFRSYRSTLRPDLRMLLDGFNYVDVARKVVGVGSVGTRCWILLLEGRDERDPLLLQVKEAQPSVLEPMLGRSKFANQGRRVVEGQRLMQAASDIFLGWVQDESEPAGPRDYYLRQLWDWKGSADIATIPPRGLVSYAEACAWTLARAHARSGDRAAIAAYLGSSDRFDWALAEFASAYADLNERDHEALTRAVAAGHVKAVEGV